MFFRHEIFLHNTQKVTRIRIQPIKFTLRNIPNLSKTQLSRFCQFTFTTIVKHNSFLYYICKEILADFQITVYCINMFYNKLWKSMTTVCKQVMIFIRNTVQFSFHIFSLPGHNKKNIIIALIGSMNTKFYISVP